MVIYDIRFTDFKDKKNIGSIELQTKYHIFFGGEKQSCMGRGMINHKKTKKIETTHTLVHCTTVKKSKVHSESIMARIVNCTIISVISCTSKCY